MNFFGGVPLRIDSHLPICHRGGAMRRLRFGVVLFVLGSASAWGQGSDAALRDRVLQLVERLDSSKMEARKSAEEALVKLGPRILPFLPEATKGTSAERKQ